MPARKQIFETNCFYHVYNRAVTDTPIFKEPSDCQFFLECAEYYLYKDNSVKFSVYRDNREKYKTVHNKMLVSVISYCLMPNHFHFELKQEDDGGIQKYIGKICNSFAHYYSKKYNKSGHIFQGNFKAATIENENLLLHVSRYIHLNPSTSCLVKDPREYAFSSLFAYLNKVENNLIDTKIILNIIGSRKRYEEFVLNQINYQKDLKKIKDVLLFD